MQNYINLQNYINQKQKVINHQKTTRKFKTFNFRNNQYETINTELKYSGKKVEIWVNENQISDAQAIRIGQEFDNNIYPLITKILEKKVT